MEFAQGGDLFAYTLGHRPHGRLAETQSRWIFQQLIIGLDYCHRKVSAVLTSALRCDAAQVTMQVIPGLPPCHGKVRWGHVSPQAPDQDKISRVLAAGQPRAGSWPL